MADGPANINNNSGVPLGPLVDLFQYVGGTQTKQSGTTNNTADISALLQILQQSMDPANLQNLVANLFSQGAQQVPGLTTQYANATGTRVNNNTMLSQSLAQLNQTLAQSIANAIVQQQANVSLPAATQIAKSTQNTQQSQQTDKNAGSGTKSTLGALLVGGWGLNKYGDKALSKAGDLLPSSTPVVAGPGTINNPFPSSSDISGTPDVSVGLDKDYVGYMDQVPAAAATPDTGFDTNLANDEFDVVPDFDVGGDVVDTGPDWGLGDFSDFGFDFADGGMVRARPAGKKSMSMKGAPSYKGKKGYADGGEVEEDAAIAPQVPQQRGTPNFGPRTLPVPTASQTFRLQPEQSPVTTIADTRDPLPAGVGRSRNVVTPDGAVDSGSVDLSGEEGHTDFGGTPTGPSSMGVASAGLALGTAGLAAGAPAAFSALVASTVFQALVNALTGKTNPDPAATQAADQSAPSDPSMGLGGNFGMSNVEGAPVGFMGDDGAAPASIGNPGDAMDFGGNFGSDPGDGDFGGDGGAPGGGSAGNSGSDGGGSDGGGGDGFAQGGEVKAKLPKQSQGIDKMQIHVTPGEYVLPVDVVSYIGEDALDQLVASIHTPIRTGTHG